MFVMTNVLTFGKLQGEVQRLEFQREIRFGHWNPHWECFSGHIQCALNASVALTNLLEGGLDFMNVVELESYAYRPPDGWEVIAGYESCGRDWDTLFFNAKQWRCLANLSGVIRSL